MAMVPSFSEEGGVKSPAPPGKDRDAGEVKALACWAVEGWVVRESIWTDVRKTRTVFNDRSLSKMSGVLVVLCVCGMRSCNRIRSLEEGWFSVLVNTHIRFL